MAALEEIEPLISEKCSEFGVELYEARFFRAGSRSILRIFIDRSEGVSIADCEQVSNALSVLLDVENFMGGRPYTLEVSSPGIDRPLKTEKDFRRIYGRNVVVHFKKPDGTNATGSGTVEQCEGGILRLSCDGTPVELPLDTILSGKEQIRFK
ncbi:MAG: ribosome maturation factor RimP [Chitinispirillaceae bacterium]|nr:ribosome maturation factor RimP [Chitinispirillaceae bacterium]